MKKRLLIALVVVLALAATASLVWADKPIQFDDKGNEIGWASSGANCVKIQEGTLYASTGELLTTGYDQYGYNYQAHMFNGRYCDYDRVIGGAYCDVDLMMKWNDAWLANVDCDGDGQLDRHHGFDSYFGSGAWLTNHIRGTYEDGGAICEWDNFVKIVAVREEDDLQPETWYAPDGTAYTGVWYTSDGTEIGRAIWGAFAIIQEIYNDPCAGLEGVWYLSPDHAGFGGW